MAGLVSSSCSETITETQLVEVVDTVRVTDTLQVTLIRCGVDTVAAGFDRPVAAQQTIKA